MYSLFVLNETFTNGYRAALFTFLGIRMWFSSLNAKNLGTNVITFISEKKIFNLNNLTYINVFTLSCKTFKDNLSLKVVCTSIFLRLVLSGIVCYLITYLS